MSVTQEVEQQVEREDHANRLTDRARDERGERIGEPGGNGGDDARQIDLLLEPLGERRGAWVAVEDALPFPRFNHHPDRCRSGHGLGDKPLRHERRGHDHGQTEQQDRHPRGHIGLSQPRLEPAVERHEQDGQRQRPRDRRHERHGHQIAEIEPDGGDRQQHENVEVRHAPPGPWCG